MEWLWPFPTTLGALWWRPSTTRSASAGTLPPEALLDFERLSASVQRIETVVHGPLQDQAALYGLLARLETFGVQVIEVRRMQDDRPPHE